MHRNRLCFVLAAALCLPAIAAEADLASQRTVLLVGQAPDNHPAGTHEYSAGMRVLAKCLEPQEQLRVRVVSADGPWLEGPDLIREADCVVLFVSEGAKWIHGDPRRLEAFAEHAAMGGGLVTLHWAMGAREARYIDGYLKLFGGCHGGPDRKYQKLTTTVRVAQADHPVTRGVANFEVEEEFYYRLKFVPAPRSIRTLLTARIDGQDEAVAWAWDRADGGRSCGFSGGHFHANWRRQEYRRLMSQAVLWTLTIEPPKKGLPVDVPEAVFQLPPRESSPK